MTDVAVVLLNSPVVHMTSANLNVCICVGGVVRLPQHKRGLFLLPGCAPNLHSILHLQPAALWPISTSTSRTHIWRWKSL